MRLVTKDSPNQSPRVHGNDVVRLAVVHTPEGSYESAINTCMARRGDDSVSYHRLYRKNGTEAVQLVPFERKAWHAGPLNSLSDGLSIEGHASRFDLSDPGTLQLARGVAERLIARKLPCQWTTDPAKGGFCRHGDLQANRTDPTPDIAEWRLFVGMVESEHAKLTAVKPKLLWPVPIPRWFWGWNLWRIRGRKGPRPTSWDGVKVPRIIPPWAWARARAFDRARKK